jgi:hypothetical protein
LEIPSKSTARIIDATRVVGPGSSWWLDHGETGRLCLVVTTGSLASIGTSGRLDPLRRPDKTAPIVKVPAFDGRLWQGVQDNLAQNEVSPSREPGRAAAKK